MGSEKETNIPCCDGFKHFNAVKFLTLANLAAADGVAVKRGYPTHGVFPGWAALATLMLVT